MLLYSVLLCFLVESFANLSITSFKHGSVDLVSDLQPWGFDPLPRCASCLSVFFLQGYAPEFRLASPQLLTASPVVPEPLVAAAWSACSRIPFCETLKGISF